MSGKVGRPRKDGAPEKAPVIVNKEEAPDIAAIQAELEAANRKIAELEKEEDPIIIMDRQAPFKVVYGKKITVNNKKTQVPAKGRYFQYGAFFDHAGVILEGQKVVIPDRPKNIRVIGRM